MGLHLIGLPAEGDSTRRRRRRLRVAFALIGIPAAVVVLAVLALFLYWWIELSGPSGSYIEHFDASRVAADAVTNERFLHRILDGLPMARQGFSLVASSYADGCYPYNDDTNENWQKVCYGRAVYFYASSDPLSTADSNLVSVFTGAGWRPSSRNLSSRPCYGYPFDILGNFRLDFVPNYELMSLSASCPYSLSETAGDTVAEYAQSSVEYSHLTRTVDEAALTRRLASDGYQSYVMISAEREYFDKPVGLYIFG